MQRLNGRELLGKCPFCAGEIKEEVIECPFCGEFLNKSDKPITKWYFSTTIVVIALLSFGPFALPLVWFHPRYKKITKLVVSFLIITLAILSFFIIKDLYLQFCEQIKALGLY